MGNKDVHGNGSETADGVIILSDDSLLVDEEKGDVHMLVELFMIVSY